MNDITLLAKAVKKIKSLLNNKVDNKKLEEYAKKIKASDKNDGLMAKEDKSKLDSLKNLSSLTTIWEGTAKVGSSIRLTSFQNYDTLKFHILIKPGSFVLEKVPLIVNDAMRFYLTGTGLKGNQKGLYVDEIDLVRTSNDDFKVNTFIQYDTETNKSSNNITDVCITKVIGIKK